MTDSRAIAGFSPKLLQAAILPRLRELNGLAVVFRDIRRRSLRYALFLEQAEQGASDLTE
jgi:hypothetical protein